MDSSVKDIEINITQWNSQSLRPKMVLFKEFLNQQKIHIAVVSETWLGNKIDLNISGYNIYRKDRNDSYGGVAIFIHKSIQSHLNSIQVLNSGIEIVAAKLLNCKDLENVVAIYCPPSVATQHADWDQVFSNFSKKTLVAGDFNGHHTNWSIKNDIRGSQIMNSSFENSFISLNDGSPTRIKLVNGLLQQTSPDISFATNDIAIKFDWKILNENLGSDHLLIKMKIKIPDDYTISKKRNYKKADWKEYKNFLSRNFTFNGNNNVQEMYDFFLQKINVAADRYIPYIKYCSKPTNKFKPKNYWNSELSHIVAQRRLCLAKFRRNPTPENLTKLEEKINECRTAIQKAKSLGWQGFCDSIDQTVSVYEMWRRMRWIKGFKKNSKNPPIEKQKELLRSLTPDYAPSKSPIFVSKNEFLEKKFNFHELENCLKKKDSAPGEDGISYSMIFNLPNSFKIFLLNIYNDIFKSGVLPVQWRNIQIIPIPKANNTHNDIKLRPISLISCLCKIFHLMIIRRLEWHIEKEKILSPYTIGFRKSMSSLDSLTRLVSYIQIGFSKNIPTLACFLDIQDAYNNVSIDVAVSLLDKLQIGSKFCSYIWSFLSERYLKIKSENSNVITGRWTNRGLAQGDPLSPLLFNLITHKIFQTSLNIIVSQYADDFVLYIKNQDIKKCEIYVQNALDYIVRSLAELGLELSASKSKYCVFSRGRRRILPSIKINEQALCFANCTKYLGMWLDQSLRWGKHINEIVDKSLKFLNILKLLTGSSWGVHTKHIRRLYISLVRSRLDYGSFLYDCSTKTHLLKLDKLQNQALRIIGGYIKSSPIHVMESDLCIPPLFLRREYLAYKYSLKTMSWSNNITVNLILELSNLCHTSYWQKKKKPLLVRIHNDIKNLSIVSSDILKMFTLEIWTTSIQKNVIKIELESLRGAKCNVNQNVLLNDVVVELNTTYYGWHKIYTDGSKSSHGLGTGLFDQSLRISLGCKINCNISIMSLELIAIYKAIEYILQQNLNKVVIFSDSKSALQHIARCASGNSRGASIAFDILNRFIVLFNNNIEFMLQWVPAHIGLRGNEEADRISKSAAVNGINITYLPDYWEYITKFRTVCFNSWKQHFF